MAKSTTTSKVTFGKGRKKRKGIHAKTKSSWNHKSKNYKNDMKILKRLRVSHLYKPSYADIFKFKTKNKIFLDPFSKKLCGKFRKSVKNLEKVSMKT